MDLDHTPATASRLRRVAERLPLTEAAYRRALELAHLAPDRTTWLRFIDRFLLAAGVLFIVAGIAAFFAYNWADLHKFAKFALVEAGIVIAVALAWWRGLDTTAGRGALFAAAFLVGVLLALYGQVYQTGADPYWLFLGWALLIAGWAVIGRQAGLWMLMVVLANVSLIFYWTQVLYPPSGIWELSRIMGPLVWLTSLVMDARLGSLVFLLNLGVLVLWEVLAARGVPAVTGRWFPRVAAIGALAVVVSGTWVLILGWSASQAGWAQFAAPVFFIGFVAGSFWYYQYRVHDLLILTACLTGAIILVTTLVAREIDLDYDTALLLAFLVIGQTAGAAVWLRNVARRWSASA